MSRRARTRQPHARHVYTNAHAIAMHRARALSAEDVAMHRTVITTAAREFAQGLHCETHWRSLADTANMAETLAAMNLGSGPDADRVIRTAQQALYDVAQRHQQRGTWTLYADEIDAIGWLVQLHLTQLAACSYGEFDTAYKRTNDRMAQALAGNGPVGALVMGEVGA